MADVAPPRDLLADRHAALVEQGEDVEDRRIGEVERRAAGGERRDVRRAVVVERIIDARDEEVRTGRSEDVRIDNIGRALDRAVIVGEFGGDERVADVPPHPGGELVAVGDLVEGLLAGDREIVERRDRVRDGRATPQAGDRGVAAALRLDRDDVAGLGKADEEVDVEILAIAGEEAVDIEFEIGRRTPLQRGVERRPGAIAVGDEGADRIRDQDGLAAGRRVAELIESEVERGLVTIAPIVDRGREHDSPFLAARRLPAAGDHRTSDPAPFFALVAVQRPRAAGDGPARIEVERPAQPYVDAAADAAFDQVRRARLVDVDSGDELGRNILQRDAAAGSGEGLAAVEVGGHVGQAADQDGVRLAVGARDLDAGDALQRIGDRIVRKLADILRHDRIGDGDRILLERLRRSQAAPDAGHDDRVVQLVVGGRGTGLVLRGRRDRKSGHGEQGRGTQNRQLGGHLIPLSLTSEPGGSCRSRAITQTNG